MFKQLKKNRSGIILITVLIISLVMAILAIGILSLNVTQVMTGEDVTRSMTAEYFGRMLLWMIYSNNLSGRPISDSAVETIGGTTYSANIIAIPNPPNPTRYNIIINYLP